METKKFNKTIKKVRDSNIHIVTVPEERISRIGTECTGGFEDVLFEKGGYELFVNVDARCSYLREGDGYNDPELIVLSDEGEAEIEDVKFYFNDEELNFTENQKKTIKKELMEIITWE